jgi:hypothetical protein
MIKHSIAQEDTWKLKKFHTDDKEKDTKNMEEYITFLRKTAHDPVRFGGGLSYGETLFYKWLGKWSFFYIHCATALDLLLPK